MTKYIFKDLQDNRKQYLINRDHNESQNFKEENITEFINSKDIQELDNHDKNILKTGYKRALKEYHKKYLEELVESVMYK
jgi:hypothetical protein